MEEASQNSTRKMRCAFRRTQNFARCDYWCGLLEGGGRGFWGIISIACDYHSIIKSCGFCDNVVHTKTVSGCVLVCVWFGKYCIIQRWSWFYSEIDLWLYIYMLRGWDNFMSHIDYMVFVKCVPWEPMWMNALYNKQVFGLRANCSKCSFCFFFKYCFIFIILQIISYEYVLKLYICIVGFCVYVFFSDVGGWGSVLTYVWPCKDTWFLLETVFMCVWVCCV